ncbi:MAG: TylF/MycF/NovP-related O-methyltransferase [Hyphomicrobiaceae bacterium]
MISQGQDQGENNDNQDVARIRSAYLDLMCNSLIGRLNQDPPLQREIGGYYDENRLNGWDWPSQAPSMIGWRRMSNLRSECERVLREQVPGDFLEAGVWRGGACIMMRAVLEAYGIRDRRVIAADTFSGLPHDTDETDAAFFLRDIPDFSVPLAAVKAAFERYGLLDEQVAFLEGEFKTTLATAPVGKLAVLRLDGDTYESAKDGLSALYDKLSAGGSVIVDDYFLFEGNRRAVDAFRDMRGITDPIVQVDDYGGYWIKAWA